MAKIIDKDFVLTSVGDSSIFYDLDLLLPTKNRTTGEVSESFKTVAYGLEITTALKKIALYRSEKGVESVSINEFCDRFQAACDSLKVIASQIKSA